MNALALVIVVGVAAQGASARRVPLDIPVAVQGVALETSVVCRDASGVWSRIGAWVPVDPRSPSAVIGNGCRVLLRRTGAAAYLASGTTHHIERADSLSFLPQWLRTVQAAPASSQPYWVGAVSPAAECLRTQAASLCLFIGVEDGGAMVTIGESRLGFALSRPGAGSNLAAWRDAPWGRLVRVRAPNPHEWQARVSVLQPALKHGRDVLQHSRVSKAAVVHRLGDETLWVEGGESEPGARLELAGTGAATTHFDLSRVRGSPLTVLDVSLAPEEVIEGDVRSDGRLLADASISLMRFLAPAPASSEDDDERPMERVGETTTNATGRFRFDGLARGEYELAVSHARRGRARVAARAPSVHRITLKPHALVRGRVIDSGVPVADATVTLLPSYAAVLAARNPAMLIGESVQTTADGRFELVAPDEGQVTLTALREGGAARIELGDARALPATVDLGDVRLDDPLDVTILLELPTSCVVAAAGPMGQPGIMLRRAESLAPGQWVLRSVLEGRWLIEASCAGADVALDPNMIDVSRRNRELVRLAPRRQPAPLR